MAKILVTGGTGFVGRWMEETEPSGHFVKYLGHLSYTAPDCEAVDWNYIVHLAPVAPKRVIRTAQKYCAKLLYASSGAVYQEKPNQYALDKIAAEKELQSSGVPHVIARLFTFTGRWLKWDNFAVGQFIRDGLKGKITILGSGAVIRSYMHGADLGAWMWRMLFDGEGVYEVGSAYGVTIHQLAQTVRDYLPNKARIETLNKIEYERQPIYVPTGLARARDLGLRVTIPFEQAIERSVKEYGEA